METVDVNFRGFTLQVQLRPKLALIQVLAGPGRKDKLPLAFAPHYADFMTIMGARIAAGEFDSHTALGRTR